MPSPKKARKNAVKPGSAKPLRAWQRMLSGRRLDLLNPRPQDIEIEDIAHGLSRVARWNGQTLGEYPFTVAQHSLLVDDILYDMENKLERRWHLACLLHDAAEYVIGDMISPFKNALHLSYRDFEDRLQRAIHRRFGLPETVPEEIRSLIKQADKTAAYFEATQLAGFKTAEAGKFFGGTPKKKIILQIEKPDIIKARYIERIKGLSR
jgi:uncharacterized protein